MIEIKNLLKQYGKNIVLNNINLNINDGEFLVVLGPSGCGKTTLLRLIAGLEDITSGNIAMDGVLLNKLPPKERNISMVFQNYALFPNMNVFENIAFGLKVRKYKKSEIEKIVKDIASRLKIDSLLKRKPSELSGGEQQRVAIARAMVKRPKIYLFDEPLSSLDVNLKDDLRQLIKDIHKETKATFIYVTHDQNEALSLADRIVIMNAGNILQIDTPMNLYDTPNNFFVAKFLGEPKISKIETDSDKVKCFVRPENIKTYANNEDYLKFSCRIVSNEFLGNGYVIKAMINNNQINMINQEKIEDKKIDIFINKNKLMFFDSLDNKMDIKIENLMVEDNVLKGDF